MYGLKIWEVLRVRGGDDFFSIPGSVVWSERTGSDGYDNYSVLGNQCVDEECVETECEMSEPFSLGVNNISADGRVCEDDVTGNPTADAIEQGNIRFAQRTLKWRRTDQFGQDAIDVGGVEVVFGQGVNKVTETDVYIPYQCELVDGYYDDIEYLYWGMNGLYKSLADARRDEPYSWFVNGSNEISISSFDPGYGGQVDFEGVAALEVIVRNNTGIDHRIVMKFSGLVYGFDYENPFIDKEQTSEVVVPAFSEVELSFEDNPLPNEYILGGYLKAELEDVQVENEDGVWETAALKPTEYELVCKMRSLLFQKRGHLEDSFSANGKARWVSGCFDSGFNKTWGYRDGWNDRYRYDDTTGVTKETVEDVQVGQMVTVTGGENISEEFVFVSGWYSSKYACGKNLSLTD